MRTFIIIAALFISTFSFAQTTLNSTEIELRAREVGHALRCVVCPNQSIEESDASLAEDMRDIVRQRIAAGESNAEVIEFMRMRYGDYVLLKPPLQRNTFLLWTLPGFIILGMGLWFVTRTRKPQADAQIIEAHSPEDQALLKRLIEND